MQDNISFFYMEGLYGYAMILSRNDAIASDLVQETYLRAILTTNMSPDLKRIEYVMLSSSHPHNTGKSFC